MTYTGGDGALLSHNPGNFRLFCTPSEGYRSSGASLSIWSTQYDSVLNKDIKIDAKKTHTEWEGISSLSSPNWGNRGHPHHPAGFTE